MEKNKNSAFLGGNTRGRGRGGKPSFTEQRGRGRGRNSRGHVDCQQFVMTGNACKTQASEGDQNAVRYSQVDSTNMKSWGRKELSAFITAFRDSDETVLVFPADLDARQRSFVHEIGAVFGFHHASHGPKSARVLTISKVEESTVALGKAMRAYRGAQAFPSLVSIRNNEDIMDVNASLNTLHSNMVKGIKVECAKSQKREHPNFLLSEPSKTHSFKAVYNESYWKLQTFRQSLPAFKEGEKVVHALRTDNVVIVCGETGSGKTTQIPQIIYKSGLIDRGKVIICTQPRRISATSVAQRVAEEMGEHCGETCGYVIRFENKTCRETKLIYMTTGILLRRLQVDPNLKEVGCVIVDEVHERDVETDFCLLLLRDRLMKQKSSNDALKVVVMSATIQIEKLKTYFTRDSRPVPAISFPGSLYPVREYFLEDALRDTGDSFDLSVFTSDEKISTAKGGNDTYAQLHNTVFSKSVVEACPFTTIVKLILHCHQSTNKFGSILVFLPGWAQIAKINSMLQSNPSSRELWILLLHSNLTSTEQHRVFQTAPQRYRKVILATNIAETSITIDDVVWVIDSCLFKGTSYDPLGNFSSLKAVAIAKANGTQRRGRAGRCQEGVCYHLLPKAVYNQLPDFLPPQIIRTSLEEICLQIKAIKPSEKCVDVLSRALDAPPLESISHSVEFLTTMGAFSEKNENLTPIGAALAQLPVHPLLGKMLFAATCFGVLELVAVVASSLSIKSPFVVPHPSEKMQARRALVSLDEGMLSDHFAVLRLYLNWIRSGRKASYANEMYADPYGLRLLERTKNQLVNLVLNSAFVKHFEKNARSVASRHMNNMELIRLVILWSLYPRIATVEFRIKRPKLPNVVCWDGSPAQFSNLSALSRRHRQDFFEKIFLVYFERIFIESSLTLSEVTAVSPLEISLCLRKLAICPVAEVPEVLLGDKASVFVPAFPFTSLSSSSDEEEGARRELESLSALFFDGGKKVYIVKNEIASLIQRIRECMDYYLVLAIMKLRADIFPDELVGIIARLLGSTLGVPSSYSSAENSDENIPSNHVHYQGLNRPDVDDEYQALQHRQGDSLTQGDANENGADAMSEFEDEFVVVYEEDEDDSAFNAASSFSTGNLQNASALFTENEIAAALQMYGDLTVLQKEDVKKMIIEAALNAQQRDEAAEASELEKNGPEKNAQMKERDERVRQVFEELQNTNEENPEDTDEA